MSAPNLKEIEWAISDLENEESSWQVYAKLANLYTCRNAMLGTSTIHPQITAYSESSSPILEELGEYGSSDFLRAVKGKDPTAVWPVIDELMETLQVVNRRVYDSVMRKISQL